MPEDDNKNVREITIFVSAATEEEIDRFVNQGPIPRDIAAIILGETADAASYGGHPTRTPFEVGRALRRIMPNNDLSVAENIAEIVKGFCFVPKGKSPK